MSKHTQGPWVISGSSIWNPETHRAIYASGGKPINERDEEGQANAALIAAAPDLLEMLTIARFALLEMANNGGALDNDTPTHEKITGPILDAKIARIDAAIAKAECR